LHGGVDLGGIGERHLAHRFTQGGIEDGRTALPCPRHDLAIDPMADDANFGDANLECGYDCGIPSTSGGHGT
jgi:hypothetical protein